VVADLFRVAAITARCPGVKTFRLVRADKRDVKSFEPGAHVSVTINDAATGRRGTRAFTLTSDPHDRLGYEITIARSERPGAVSELFHTGVRLGRVLSVSAPVQGFAIPPGDSPMLLIAGGIGITPIYSMARALAVVRRPFDLFYSAKSADRLLFLEELHAFTQGRCVLRTTSGPDAARLDIPAILATSAPDTQVCVCGPAHMIEAVRQAAADLGWAGSRVHAESFAGASSPDDVPFQVQLARLGRRVEVPAGQSILDALLAAGVNVEYDCRHGSCGRCTQHVLGGVPDHKDHHRAGDDDECIRICVSRSKSPVLTLDL